VEIVFTQSSRRHRVGRTRIRDVLAAPVVVVMEPDRVIVIHAMDIRTKFYGLYEEGLR
jgi:hypothetical protein